MRGRLACTGVPVNEAVLTGTIAQLQALVEWLGSRQAEAAACLDKHRQIERYPDERGRLKNPIDPGTGAPMTAARRNAIWDACHPEVEELLALFPEGSDSNAPHLSAQEGPPAQA